MAFSTLLKSYVDKGVVNYKGFIDNTEFNSYIDYIANKQFSKKNSRNEKLAFYINAYNALAIKGIINGSSPSSFFGRIRYFRKDKYIIAQKKMNLYDLEHKIIRPFNEPRIHFALVCASASCPLLRSEAYTAEELDSQLEENAITFINDTSKNSFDLDKDRAYLSKIFDWFEEDFEDSTSLQKYLAKFVKDQSVKNKLNNDALKIRHLKYDWSLNGNF